MTPRTLEVESQVLKRYSQGAQAVQPSLCCPVDYDPQYLKVIPQEILEKDYGCGDPSAHLREGETVLDLGSGGGKICYIASQIVGPKGHVIGVDMNDDMLSLAEKYHATVAKAVGWDNVEFRKGRIQDLRLPVAELEDALKSRPAQNFSDWQAMEETAQRLRVEKPLIPDSSVDVVVSNCVLNLVREEEKPVLFREIFRVLKRGGRAVISDIVSDEEVPAHLKADANLWSGCVSGALQEGAFIRAFEAAGFYGIRILKRDEKPWQTVEGIEFRSVTLEAFKGKEGPCLDRKQAVIYQGPWKVVMDDDGHTLRRGDLMAVCDKTFNIYTDAKGPYAKELTGIQPRESVPLDAAEDFNCRNNDTRDPKELKGAEYKDTDFDPDAPCCGPGECC